MIDKAFYDDATKSQRSGGANVVGAERQRAAGLSRAHDARAVENVKEMLKWECVKGMIR